MKWDKQSRIEMTGYVNTYSHRDIDSVADEINRDLEDTIDDEPDQYNNDKVYKVTIVIEKI